MQKHTLTNKKKRTYYQKHQTKQNNENKIKTATITRRPLSQMVHTTPIRMMIKIREQRKETYREKRQTQKHSCILLIEFTLKFENGHLLFTCVMLGSLSCIGFECNASTLLTSQPFITVIFSTSFFCFSFRNDIFNPHKFNKFTIFFKRLLLQKPSLQLNKNILKINQLNLFFL